MKSKTVFLSLAVAAFFVCPLKSQAAAPQWGQPAGTKSVETMVCNTDSDNEDAHGQICLKLDCVAGRQYQFTVIADLPIVGDTKFSAGAHSIDLNMQAMDPGPYQGWNVSRSFVEADFLNRVASEKQLVILNAEGASPGVALTLSKFTAELRRLSATCKEAK